MRNGGQVLVHSLVALGATLAPLVCRAKAIWRCWTRCTTPPVSWISCCAGTKAAQPSWRRHGGKLTGAPGICMVTRGPGVTNASIGIHTAMQDSAPMIVFVGQVAPA